MGDPSLRQDMTRMLWLDLEMTGLDVEKEVIIEVAAIVTDLQLEEIDTYHTVVKQPQSYIDGMDQWNQDHHGASGLTKEIPNGKEPTLVEDELLEFISKHFKNERAVLCGNSISQDRLFIKKYFRSLEDKLHYRILDVTSWKLVFQNWFQIEHEKKGTHRALDDIRESIDEFRTYLTYIQADSDSLIDENTL